MADILTEGGIAAVRNCYSCAESEQADEIRAICDSHEQLRAYLATRTYERDRARAQLERLRAALERIDVVTQSVIP